MERFGVSQAASETGTYTPVGGFTDDFEDGSYSGVWTCSATCTESGGELSVSGSWQNATPVSGNTSGDFLLETNMSRDSGTVDILYRRASNGYHYRMAISSGSVDLYRWNNNSYTQLTNGTASHTFTAGTKYNVQLLVEGTRHQVIVDGERLIDTTDTQHTATDNPERINLWGAASGTFADFRVTPLLATDTTTDTSATDASAPAAPTGLGGSSVSSWSTDPTPTVTWTDSVDAGDTYYFYASAYDQLGNVNQYFSDTNVVTNTDLNTGWSQGYTQNIQWDDIPPPMGIDAQVVSFENDDTSGNGYWYSYGDYAPQADNTTYTVSLWAKTDQTSNVRIRFYTADNGESDRYTSEFLTVNASEGWKLLVWDPFTTANPTDSDSLSFQYYDLYEGGYTRMWLAAPQMEPGTSPSFIENATVTTGLDGYATSWTQGATDISSPSKNLENAVQTATSSSLADANNWYFNILPVDNAGNWMTSTSTVHRGPFYIDTTGPVCTVSNGSGNPTGDDTPTLNLTLNDAGIGSSGAQMRFSCDNATWTTWESYTTPKTTFDINSGSNGCPTADGSRTVYVQCRDSLANAGSSANTGSFALDTTPPVITITDNASGSWAQSDSIAATISDAGGNFNQSKWTYDADGTCPTSAGSYASAYISGSTLNVTSDHNDYICFYADDTLGWSQTQATTQLKVDVTAPTGGYVSNGSGSPQNYQNTTPIAITVERGTDALSGMSATNGDYLLEYRAATLSNESCGTYGSWTDTAVSETAAAKSYNYTGTNAKCYQFRYTVEDVAGNSATWTGTDATKIDTTNPTCGSWSPSSNQCVAGSSQTFTLSGSTDTLSGINDAGGSCAVTVSGNSCIDEISDNAGNSLNCTSPTATFDNAAPAVPAMNQPTTPTLSTSFSVTSGTVTDSGCDGNVEYQFCRNTSDSTTGCTASSWGASASASYSGMSAGNTYYFFVRSRDGLSNTSNWSSSVSVRVVQCLSDSDCTGDQYCDDGDNSGQPYVCENPTAATRGSTYISGGLLSSANDFGYVVSGVSPTSDFCVRYDVHDTEDANQYDINVGHTTRLTSTQYSGNNLRKNYVVEDLSTWASSTTVFEFEQMINGHTFYNVMFGWWRSEQGATDGSTSSTCCDTSTDCVDDYVVNSSDGCYTTGTLRNTGGGDGADTEECRSGTWYAQDSDSTACTNAGNSWNIGGEVDGTTCCEDDSGENNLTSTYELATMDAAADGSDACCAASNDCVDASTCYDTGTTHDADADGDSDVCDVGTWKDCTTDSHCDTAAGYHCSAGGDCVAWSTDMTVGTSRAVYDASEDVELRGNDSILDSGPWAYKLPFEVDAAAYDRTDYLISMPVDFTQLFTDMGTTGTMCDTCVRVVEYNPTTGQLTGQKPVRFLHPGPAYDAATNAKGRIDFVLDGTTTKNTTRNFFLFFDKTENGAKSAQPVAFDNTQVFYYPETDLDQDGEMEIVVADHNYGVEIIKWNGSSYQSVFRQAFDMGTYPGLAIADTDGNGIPNLIVSYYSNGYMWSFEYNPATQQYENVLGGSTGIIDSGGNPYNVTVGDLDGDGDVEIIDPGYGADRSFVFGWTGSAYALESNLDVADPSYWNSGVDYTSYERQIDNQMMASVGDIDGDGALEFVSQMYASSGRRNIWQYGGNGTYEHQEYEGGGGYNYWGSAMLDVDMDGLPELISSNASTDGPRVFEYDEETGVWTATETIDTGYDYQNVGGLADWDGDGYEEFITGNYDGRAHIFQYNPTTGAYEREWYSQDHGNFGLTATFGDVDGDGTIEAIYPDVGNIHIYDPSSGPTDATPEATITPGNSYYGYSYTDSLLISGMPDPQAHGVGAPVVTRGEAEAGMEVSVIENTSSETIDGYLDIAVQKDTAGWSTIATPVSDSSQSITAGATLDVSSVWSTAGSWNTAANTDGDYRIKMDLKDTAGGSILINQDDLTPMTATYEFTIDTTAPTISANTPALGAVVADPSLSEENTYDYTWKIDTNELAKCRFAPIASETWADMVPFDADFTTTHIHRVQLVDESSYDLYIKCRDQNDNESSEFHLYFTTEWDNRPTSGPANISTTLFDQTETVTLSGTCYDMDTTNATNDGMKECQFQGTQNGVAQNPADWQACTGTECACSCTVTAAGVGSAGCPDHAENGDWNYRLVCRDQANNSDSSSFDDDAMRASVSWGSSSQSGTPTVSAGSSTDLSYAKTVAVDNTAGNVRGAGWTRNYTETLDAGVDTWSVYEGTTCSGDVVQKEPFVAIFDQDGTVWTADMYGDGSFSTLQARGVLFMGSSDTFDGKIADFNNDGYYDIVSGGDSDLRIFGGAADGSLTSQYITSTDVMPGDEIRGFTVADFDNDGDYDIFGLSESETEEYFENTGSWNFTHSTLSLSGPAGTHPSGGDAADFDQDGNMDAIFAQYGYGTIIYFGNGDDTFDAPIQMDTDGWESHGIAAADFTGDGKPDYIKSTGSGGDYYLYTNDGTGTSFTRSGPIFDSGDYGGVGNADFDGDGDQDLFISHENNWGVTARIAWNDGVGGFTLKNFWVDRFYGLYPSANYSYAAAAPEYDPDIDTAEYGYADMAGNSVDFDVHAPEASSANQTLCYTWENSITASACTPIQDTSSTSIASGDDFQKCTVTVTNNADQSASVTLSDACASGAETAYTAIACGDQSLTVAGSGGQQSYTFKWKENAVVTQTVTQDDTRSDWCVAPGASPQERWSETVRVTDTDGISWTDVQYSSSIAGAGVSEVSITSGCDVVGTLPTAGGAYTGLATVSASSSKDCVLTWDRDCTVESEGSSLTDPCCCASTCNDTDTAYTSSTFGSCTDKYCDTTGGCQSETALTDSCAAIRSGGTFTSYTTSGGTCGANAIQLDSDQTACTLCTSASAWNDGGWNLGGEVSATTCCGDDASEYSLDSGYDSTVDNTSQNASPAATDACCDTSSDCVNGNSCYATGTVSVDVNGNQDNDFCNSGTWYDCSTVAQCDPVGEYAYTESTNACGSTSECTSACTTNDCIYKRNDGWGDCDNNSGCVSGNCVQDTTGVQPTSTACDQVDGAICGEGSPTYDICLSTSGCMFDSDYDGDLSDCGGAEGGNCSVANGSTSADVDNDGDNDLCDAGTWKDCSSDSHCQSGEYCESNDCVSLSAPSLDSVTVSTEKPLNSELGKITISWSGNPPSGYFYNLEELSPTNQQIYYGSSTSYTYDDISDDQRYCFRVRLQNAQTSPTNTSGWSSTVCDITSDRTGPDSPDVTATADNANDEVDLSLSAGDDDLLLYMPFEEGSGSTAYDWSANDNDGTGTGVSYTTGATGNGGAVTFGGDGDIIESNAYTYSFGTEMTLSGWFKMAGSGTGSPRILEISKLGDADSHCLAVDSNGSLRGWAECATGTRVAEADDSTTYNDGQWHHMVYVYSSPNATLYVDGVATATASGSCADLDDGPYLTVGAVSDVSGYYNHGDHAFQGDVDEIRVYDRALTETEVTDLMQSGLERFGVSQAASASGTYVPLGGVYDDFSDGDYSGWTYQNPGTSTFSVIGGVLTQSDVTEYANLVEDSQTFTDFLYEGNLRWNSATTHIRVLFRYTDENNYYSFTLRPNYADARIDRRVSGNYLQIGSYESLSSSQGTDDVWHRVTVVVQGNNIKAYVDDILVMERTDASLSSGKFGLSPFDGIAEFDNVKVTPLLTTDTTSDTTATDDTAPAAPTGLGGDATSTWSTDTTPTVTWTDSVDAGDDYFFFVNAYDQLGNVSPLQMSFDSTFAPFTQRNLGEDSSPKIVTSEKYAGAGSLYFKGVSDGAEVYTPYIPVTEGSTVQVRVWSKGSGIVLGSSSYHKAYAVGRWYKDGFVTMANGEGGFSGFPDISIGLGVGTWDWRETIYTWTVPTGAKWWRAYLGIVSTGTGELWIDDMRVSTLDSATVTTGLDGYATSWTQGETDISSPSKNLENAVQTATSSSLADANNWYFNILPVDNAGNWLSSTSTVHRGPYQIDATDPTVAVDAVASWVEGTVALGAALTDATSGLSDGACEISIYTSTPSYSGTGVTDDYSAGATSGNCDYSWDTTGSSSGTTYTINFRASDQAGNTATDTSPATTVVCNDKDFASCETACTDTYGAGTFFAGKCCGDDAIADDWENAGTDNAVCVNGEVVADEATDSSGQYLNVDGHIYGCGDSLGGVADSDASCVRRLTVYCDGFGTGSDTWKAQVANGQVPDDCNGTADTDPYGEGHPTPYDAATCEFDEVYNDGNGSGNQDVGWRCTQYAGPYAADCSLSQSGTDLTLYVEVADEADNYDSGGYLVRVGDYDVITNSSHVDDTSYPGTMLYNPEGQSYSGVDANEGTYGDFFSETVPWASLDNPISEEKTYYFEVGLEESTSAANFPVGEDPNSNEGSCTTSATLCVPTGYVATADSDCCPLGAVTGTYPGKDDDGGACVACSAEVQTAGGTGDGLCESKCGAATQCDEQTAGQCADIATESTSWSQTAVADEKCDGSCGYSSCDQTCCTAAVATATVENQACSGTSCTGTCTAGNCEIKIDTGYGDCDADAVCASGNCWVNTVTPSISACDTTNGTICGTNDWDMCVPSGGCQVDGSTYVSSGNISTDLDSDGDNDFCDSGTWKDCSTDAQCPLGSYCDGTGECTGLTEPTGLTVTVQTDKSLNSELGKLSISWSDNAPVNYEYKLEEISPTAQQIYYGDPALYTYDDISADQRYCFRVRIQDTESSPAHYSSWSTTACAITADRIGPDSPVFTTPLPRSCSEILAKGNSTGDGLYTIDPLGTGSGFQAYCDMTTDGGGWTLVWSNTRDTAGTASSGFTWDQSLYTTSSVNGTLGTDLTAFDQFLGLAQWETLGDELRIDWAPETSATAQQRMYADFSFDEANNYTLQLSNPDQKLDVVGSGLPGLYSTHNNRPFTTIDADNDSHSSANCASSYGNPWWYVACWSGNISGYNVDDGAYWTGASGSSTAQGNGWIYLRGAEPDAARIDWAEGDDDLVLYLPFEEGTGSVAYDWSQGDNDGTISGATYTTGDTGNGGAMSFNGTSDYIDCGNDSSLDIGTSDLTLSAWFKTSATSTSGIIGRTFSGSGHRYALFSNTSQGVGALIAETGHIGVWAGNSYFDNNWHFAAASYDRDGDLSLYIDGIFIDSVDISSLNGVDLQPQDNCAIGIYPDGTHSPANYFPGDIDEVRIYSRALTQQEIIDDMQSGVPEFLPSHSTSASGTYAHTRSRLSCSEIGDFENSQGSAEVCGESDAASLGGSCSGAVTYAEAVDFCEAAGARLCTLEEMSNQETDSTGCGYDAEQIWTLSPCDTDSYWTQTGDKNGYGTNIQCTAASTSSGFYARCCADVDTSSSHTALVDTSAADTSAPAAPTGLGGSAVSTWSTDDTPTVTWTDAVDAGDTYYFFVNAYDQLGNISNMVEHGGFEDAVDHSSGSFGTYSFDNTESYSGSYSLKVIDSVEYEMHPDYNQFEPGGTYRLSAWIKEEATVSGCDQYLHSRWYFADATNVTTTGGDVPSDGEWHQASVSITLPSSRGAITNYNLYLGYDQSCIGTRWIDDVRIERVTSDTVTTGLDGYAISWTQGATDITSPTKNVEDQIETLTSSSLADANNWYLNILPVDNAGNWLSSASTVHRGPFQIDTTSPSVTVDGVASWVSGTVSLGASVSDATAGFTDGSCEVAVYESSASWSGTGVTDDFSAGATSGNCDYSWDTTTATDGTTYNINFRVSDQASNTAADVTPETTIVCNDQDTGSCQPACEATYGANAYFAGQCCGDDGVDDDWGNVGAGNPVCINGNVVADEATDPTGQFLNIDGAIFGCSASLGGIATNDSGCVRRVGLYCDSDGSSNIWKTQIATGQTPDDCDGAASEDPYGEGHPTPNDGASCESQAVFFDAGNGTSNQDVAWKCLTSQGPYLATCSMSQSGATITVNVEVADEAQASTDGGHAIRIGDYDTVTNTSHFTDGTYPGTIYYNPGRQSYSGIDTNEGTYGDYFEDSVTWATLDTAITEEKTYYLEVGAEESAGADYTAGEDPNDNEGSCNASATFCVPTGYVATADSDCCPLGAVTGTYPGKDDDGGACVSCNAEVQTAGGTGDGLCESKCGAATQCDEQTAGQCADLTAETTSWTQSAVADEKCGSDCGYSSCDQTCCTAAVGGTVLEGGPTCTTSSCTGTCTSGNCEIKLSNGYGDCDANAVCSSGNCFQNPATPSWSACDTSTGNICGAAGTDLCMPTGACQTDISVGSYVSDGDTSTDLDSDGDNDFCDAGVWKDCETDAQCQGDQYCDATGDCAGLAAPTNLQVTAQTDQSLNSETGKISLSWAGALTAGYEYLLETTAPTSASVYTGSTASYTHTSLADNQRYCYRVRKQDAGAAHTSAWSSTVCDITEDRTGPPTSDVTATADNANDEVDLSLSAGDSDLVLYLPFEEGSGSTAYDWSSSDNDGTISGATFVDGKAGNGGAMSFNGTSDYISIADDTSQDITGDVTISAWAKPVSGTMNGFILGKHVDANNDYILGYRQDLGFFIQKRDAGMGYQAKSGAVTTDTWHHVSVTYTSTTNDVKVYVDGIDETIASTGIAGYNTDDELVLGRRARGGSSDIYFDGDIDEVRVYSRALTQTEIIDDMQSGRLEHEISRADSAGGTYEKLPLYTPGTGVDGSLTVSTADTVVNDSTYLTQDVAAGSLTLPVANGSAFDTGDEVLLIQMQEGDSDCTAGMYEFRHVASVDGNTLTLRGGTRNQYCYFDPEITNPVTGENPPAGDHTASVAQVVRVPNYTDVTVQSGASIVADHWNGAQGGIVAFRATGDVDIQGEVSAYGRGFRGGAVFNPGNVDDGGQGEGITGWGKQGETAVCDDRYLANGIGGGGSATPVNDGGDGAAGGGHATSGQDCQTGNTQCSNPLGGGTVGSSSLEKMFFGGGGGGGSDSDDSGCDQGLFDGLDSTYYCQRGGHGGGIVFIAADTISNANVNANGHSTDPVYDGGPGGGAGGTVWLQASNITVDTLSAAGGPSVCDNKSLGDDCGGAGGDGRVRLDYTSLGGSVSTPAVGYEGKLNQLGVSYADAGATDDTAPAAPTGLGGDATSTWSTDTTPTVSFTDSVDAGDDYFFFVSAYDQLGNVSNMLANGSFENGESSWSVHSPYDPATDEVKRGAFSLKGIHDGTIEKPYALQDVTVEVGKMYRVSGWIKSDLTAGNHYITTEGAFAGLVETNITGTTDWTYVEKTGTATTTNLRVLVYPHNYPNGSTWTDDIRVEEVDSTTVTTGLDGYATSWTQGVSDISSPSKNLENSLETITSSALADGNNWYLNILPVDNAGNWAAATATVHRGPYQIDTTGPAGGSVTHTDGYQSTADISVVVDPGADAGAGLSSTAGDYLLEYRSATLSAGSCGSFGSWTDTAVSETAAATEYTFTGTSGNCYQFRYTVADALGTTSTFTSSDTTKLDTGVPDIVALDAGPDSSDRTELISDAWFRRNVSGSYPDTGGDDQISFSWTDPASGSNDTFYYELNASATADSIDGTESSTSNPYVDNITVAEGTSYFHVRPKTGAGVWGTERVFILKYDKTNPTYNAVSLSGCTYINGSDCWVTAGQTFYVSLTHTDAISGTTTQYLEFTKDNANVGGWDGSDNIKSSANSLNVGYGNVFTSYTENPSVQDDAHLDIQEAVCDTVGGCGAPATAATGKWKVVTGSGTSAEYGVTAYMYDRVANGSGYSQTGEWVKIDNDDPTVTDDYLHDGVWVGTEQTITLTPGDGTGSGVASTKYCWGAACDPASGTAGTTISVTTNTDDTLRYKTWDNVGRVSTLGSIDVKVDLDGAPEIVAVDAGASLSDRTSLTSATWFQYPATGLDDQISFSWTDPESTSDDTFFYELNTTSTPTITGTESSVTTPYVDGISITDGVAYFHVRPQNGMGTWGTEYIFTINYNRCAPPASGDWTLPRTCEILDQNYSVPGDIIIDDSVILKLQGTTKLHFDGTPPQRIRIRSGGKITTSDTAGFKR
ncbi:MAG: FG-GAP-like repeat-containing protein [Candidatus Gracilibacteria bacterium]|nr:FG-GAP-like repeat-containing protein [Candidatus Gracilibacteria bacterium]